MDKMVYRVLAATSLVVLGFIAIGGLMTAAAGTPSLRGQRIDIGGGRHMHMICEGPVSGTGPTVLFEAGAFGFSADWGAVQEGLTKSGQRSCAYDRAGLGQSDPGPGPRDANAIVGDLEKLLTVANEPGPYIYVGHSMAGVYARLFTARNADKVVGVVLVAEGFGHHVPKGYIYFGMAFAFSVEMLNIRFRKKRTQAVHLRPAQMPGEDD